MCVQACVSVLSAMPEGTALTPSLLCPTLARVVGLLLSHTLSSQAADVPRNAGKRGVGGVEGWAASCYSSMNF